MQDLIIEETKFTPQVEMLYEKGYITIRGKSYPENTFEFYKPVFEWMENYFDGKVKETTTVDLEIIYFNSSSSKLFFDFFDFLDENKDKTLLKINWLYDKANEPSFEIGEGYQEDFEELSIKLIEK